MEKSKKKKKPGQSFFSHAKSLQVQKATISSPIFHHCTSQPEVPTPLSYIMLKKKMKNNEFFLKKKKKKKKNWIIHSNQIHPEWALLVWKGQAYQIDSSPINTLVP